jgi:tRNA (guanine-N7-)-methyltransferase
MPHILLESTYENFTCDKKFQFIASGEFDQKIAVISEDKEFLLTKLDKNGDDLIKTDIPTRLSPVSLMKKALDDYSKKTAQKVLFSNIHSIKNKVAPEEKYLKDIDFFLNKFQTTKDIYVEVGFGSGKHLLHQAKENPGKIIIGLEIHYPSIEQVLKQAKLQNIENILVINYDARLFLEFLDSNSVERIFVHFPVPWDKKPHRRVMSGAFIEESLRVLKVSGTLELRTDSSNYFEYTLELLKSFYTYPFKILKNKELDVTSKYEARWKKQEKNIWDVIIESTKESPSPIIEGEFVFPYKYDKQILTGKLMRNTIREEEFFIHIEDIYDIKVPFEGLLIKVTFGSFNKPVTKYLLLQDGDIRYFQGEPIRTRTNLEAHAKLLEILK